MFTSFAMLLWAGIPFVLGIISLSIASPTPHQLVRHEKRATSPHWIRRSRVAPEIRLPVQIALTQSNLHAAHDRLMEISDPRSEKYGQHMSAKEVASLFRPKGESVQKVQEWLHNSGIHSTRHRISTSGSWLRFNVSVDELESLLAAEYHIFQHSATEEDHIGCDEYHLPQHIREHVDFVFPSVSFAKVKETRGEKLEKKWSSVVRESTISPYIQPAPKLMTPNDLELPCWSAVTPDCIRQLYGIPKGNSSHPGNEIGIFETGDYYDQEDLDLTFAVTAPELPNGTHPILHGIDGGYAPFEGMAGGESILDMTLIIPLVYPQNSILYQVDDWRSLQLYSGFGNTFLDALDASYCTFEGGDDPNHDPVYPDLPPYPADQPQTPNGTWGQTEMCGAYKPTNVISISYGYGESTRLEYSYENRQCQEFLKLGLQGVTVIVSSGDSGVAGHEGCTFRSDGSSPPSGSFTGDFPNTCPYVTSVGGTMLNDTTELVETAANVPNSFYYSGGGFSNLWPTPDYQLATVQHYFNTTPPLQYGNPYNNSYYNASGRGFPDVSAVSVNQFLYLSGQPVFSGGTSAAAPIFASIITLINERRLEVGKGPVGFINPILYQNADAFNDITTGNNPGCSTNGFDAVKGWDPVTGLGSPNFEKLLKVFMDLP